MKKFFVGLAAMSLVVPSVASAETAAQALSVKAAAVQPVRAAADAGETKAIAVVPAVLLLLVLGGAIWLIVDSSSN